MVMARFETAARIWAEQVAESFRLAREVRTQIENRPSATGTGATPPPPPAAAGAEQPYAAAAAAAAAGGAPNPAPAAGPNGAANLNTLPIGGAVLAAMQWWLHAGTAWEKVADALMATGSETEPFIYTRPTGTVPTIDIVVDSRAEDACSLEIATDLPERGLPGIPLKLFNVNGNLPVKNAYALVSGNRLTVNVPGLRGTPLPAGLDEEHWLGILWRPENREAGAERDPLATVHFVRVQVGVRGGRRGTGEAERPGYVGEGEELKGTYGDAVPPSPESQ